ncbi:hypothetical protein KIPB_014701, partial [Kipferlia bialata]
VGQGVPALVERLMSYIDTFKALQR